MDTIGFVAPVDSTTQQPRGHMKLVPGQFGQGIEFSFADKCQGAFFMRRIDASGWDQADGISLYVKGDGSDHLGGIELIDREDFSKRYAISFSIKHMGWKKIVVPWRDMIPDLSRAPFIDPKGGYKSSQLGNLWIGKWWYWLDFGACSYAIDALALEPKIEATQAPVPNGEPLSRIRKKFLNQEPVTIVLMGDSLTDYAHWANRQVNWPSRLKAELKKAFSSEASIINTAIGGTTLRQNLVLMPRWTEGSAIDLVLVFFGGNDFNEGMRGPAFEATLRYAVDRTRQMTGGAEVILLTTAPSLNAWTTTEELAAAARAVAKAKRTGLADVAAAFHAAGDADLQARKSLFVSDAVHLGAAGHDAVSRCVLDVLQGIAPAPVQDP